MMVIEENLAIGGRRRKLPPNNKLRLTAALRKHGGPAAKAGR